jgi:hypothetical protein
MRESAGRPHGTRRRFTARWSALSPSGPFGRELVDRRKYPPDLRVVPGGVRVGLEQAIAWLASEKPEGDQSASSFAPNGRP